jgi:ABC-type multidrug transport system fused ATPase/permease subunit
MRLIRYSWSLLTVNRKLFVLWFIVMVIASCIVVVPPIMIGKMIDIAIPSKEFETVTLYSLFIAAAFLGSAWLQTTSKYMLELMVNEVVRHLKERLFASFHRKHLRSLLTFGTDSLYQRATNTIKIIQEKIVLIMRDVLGVTISAFISFAVIATIDVRIPILFLVVYIPYILLRVYIFKKKGYSFYEQAESQSQIINAVREVIQGIRLVKTAGSEEKEIIKFQKRQKENIRIQIKHIHIFSSLLLLNILMTLIPEIIVYGYLGYKVFHGENSVGQMLLVAGLLTQIRVFIWQVSRYSLMMQEFKEHLGRIYEIEQVSDEPYISGKDSKVDIDSLLGGVSFRNLRFSYNKTQVLKDFNLDIESGTSIGIVGLSGVGKTTLANLLIGLEAPDQGEICLDGIPITSWDIQRLRQRICFITQSPFLMNATIKENIIYGFDWVDEQKIWESLSNAYLEDFVRELDCGLDSVIGEQGIQLSGGQKQRLSIARAYLSDPAIIILDEATASLDLESENKVHQALEHLCHGRTSLIIAHRLSTLANTDRIIVLKEGVIVEQGTHIELIRQRRFYYNLFTEQYRMDKSEVRER